MKTTIPKQFKLAAKKDEALLIDIMKPKVQAVIEVVKQKEESKLKPKQPVDEKKFKPDSSDVIEIAVHARKENKNEPLSEMEAKKQKIAVPKPIKLKAATNE